MERKKSRDRNRKKINKEKKRESYRKVEKIEKRKKKQTHEIKLVKKFLK